MRYMLLNTDDLKSIMVVADHITQGATEEDASCGPLPSSDTYFQSGGALGLKCLGRWLGFLVKQRRMLNWVNWRKWFQNKGPEIAAGLHDLPQDIILDILCRSQLEPSQLLRTAIVCKELANVVRTRTVVKDMIDLESLVGVFADEFKQDIQAELDQDADVVVSELDGTAFFDISFRKPAVGQEHNPSEDLILEFCIDSDGCLIELRHARGMLLSSFHHDVQKVKSWFNMLIKDKSFIYSTGVSVRPATKVNKGDLQEWMSGAQRCCAQLLHVLFEHKNYITADTGLGFKFDTVHISYGNLEAKKQLETISSKLYASQSLKRPAPPVEAPSPAVVAEYVYPFFTQNYVSSEGILTTSQMQALVAQPNGNTKIRDIFRTLREERLVNNLPTRAQVQAAAEIPLPTPNQGGMHGSSPLKYH